MTVWKIRNKTLEIGKMPLIMGILNVTPDSFSDGGKFNSIDKALFHAEEMIKEGASIIDVGGESTRPGYTFVSVEEEIERVAPVIEEITKRFDTTISIDTYKSEVARAALAAGAHIVNDIHGFRYDSNMANVTKEFEAGAVLMANFSDKKPEEDILSYEAICYEKSLKLAFDAGLSMEQILLDPGVGFGTNRDEDLALIRNLDSHDRILLGVSRKRIVAHLIERETIASERVTGSVALALAGAARGIKVIRVHDVQATSDGLKAFMAAMNY